MMKMNKGMKEGRLTAQPRKHDYRNTRERGWVFSILSDGQFGQFTLIMGVENSTWQENPKLLIRKNTGPNVSVIMV